MALRLIGDLLSGRAEEQRIMTYDGANVWWWLRSPGHTTKLATAVTHSRRLEVGGYFVKEKFGVRPALWIKVSDLKKDSLKRKVCKSTARAAHFMQ